MLSSEKYPNDPSCPSDDDERPNDKLKTVDLSTSSLEKGPKFSIREYVCSTRNEDFANNWPFSQNNMQLCLKHGVKDLLPPFQSPDLMRNLSHVQENQCDSTLKLSDHSINHFELVKSSNTEIDPSLFAESSSVNPSVPEEADKVSEGDTQTASMKREITNQTPIKKRRLVMKYSNIPHTSTRESTIVNAVMNSEAAVCPVCRTFSSSSNTTLNAHIDQCLSGGYTTKSVADSKMIRNKIKPRKIKLMVDIYKTSPHCTLEDLDRRNGTNWASTCTVSPPEVQISTDSKGSGLNAKETTGDGSVYVDSNGTKLRILSKFSNPVAISSKVVDTPQPSKFLNKGKGSMDILAKNIKKVRNQNKKQKKCLRLDKHGRKLSNGQDGIISSEEIYGRDGRMEKQQKSSDQVKWTETAKGCLLSKKTDVMKMINRGDDKRQSRECMDRNLLVKHSLSSLTNSPMKKLSDLKFRNVDSPGKSGRNDNSSYKAHDESRKNHSVRKKSLVLNELSERGVNDKLENGSSYHNRHVKIGKTRVRKAGNPVANTILSSGHRSLVSKAKKFSSLSKKLSFASHASVLDSRFSQKKFKVFSESQSDEEETTSHSGTDQSEDFSNKVTEKDFRWGDTSSEEESYNKNVVLKVRNSGESIISREEEEIAMKSSVSTSMHSRHDPDSWKENVSLMRGSITRRNSDNVDQLSEVDVSGQFTRFSDSVEVGYLGLSGLHNSQRYIEEYRLPTNSTDPVLTSGSDIFCSNLIPDTMRIENECVMVDQIPIPGPPGSFLPSPRHMDSDDLHGNSSLTSTRVQSLDDHHDFADQSSESHASDISTVLNSNIRLRSGSEPSEKVPSVISASTIDAVETTCPPNTLAEIPSKEILLPKISLNYQDSPLLQRRTMASICNTSCGSNGTLDNSVQGRDDVKSVAGIVSSSVYNDNEVKFQTAYKEESVSPAPSTPVIRLMGKNLMVMNKDENSAIALANLQPVSGVYSENFHNEQGHRVTQMTIRDPCFFNRAETYNTGSHHSNVTFSKVYGNIQYGLAKAAGNEAGSTAAASHNMMGFIRDGAVCLAGTSKSDPRTTVDSSGLVQFPNGSNSTEILRWNCTLETSNVPHAGLNSVTSSSGAPFISETLGSFERNK